MTYKAKVYIDQLIGRGRIAFTIGQMQNDLGITNKAARRMLERLLYNKEITTPAKGYYLILTPEFRTLGCLPPNYFIDDLMSHWHKIYYVGLLSAAMFHGAAHQQPQNVQVVLPATRPDIICGKVAIQFIQNAACHKTPVEFLKTPTGTLLVSTIEATAMDLVRFMRQSAGINRVATVLHELGEQLDKKKLLELTTVFKESAWVQRLGYLLELLGHEDTAQSLLAYLKTIKSRRIPLVPYLGINNAEKCKKWQLYINAKVESDLDDTE
ncbi:MAG: type IV toxin-antitoxin system AbiEi family antitoxin [Legionellales bacterium]|nr:type IV toxin-antitoxin system AbiEi family antitoxin [Legionellales bacterium]